MSNNDVVFRRGFTLIEVLISIGIFGIIIAAIASLLFNDLSWMRVSRWDTLAQEAVIREMERVKTLTWTELVAISGPFGGLPRETAFTNGLNAIPGAAGGVFVSSTLDNNIKRVTVAAYVYGRTNPRSVWRLSGFITRNALTQ